MHVHRIVPGVRQHVLVPERSQPVEDKRLDDGGIALVIAAVDDDRGSRPGRRPRLSPRTH